jgi:hypothetical protein
MVLLGQAGVTNQLVAIAIMCGIPVLAVGLAEHRISGP